MSEDTNEQTAFEVWAVTNNFNIRLADESSPYTYFAYETEQRWIVWQAAIAHKKNESIASSQTTAEALNVAKSFIGEIVTFGGKYSHLNGMQIVADANRTLSEIRALIKESP